MSYQSEQDDYLFSVGLAGLTAIVTIFVLICWGIASLVQWFQALP